MGGWNFYDPHQSKYLETRCPTISLVSHPSKPCRATSALAGRAYSAAGQADSALHSMAVLHVFQAKMLANEEAGLDSASLRDLRSATDLALRVTKATAQAIWLLMSSLIVLERHFWLTMTERKEADKVPFLHAPVSSSSLFGPAVEDLLNASRRLRSSLSCDTSLLSVPALPLLPVAPDLR